MTESLSKAQIDRLGERLKAGPSTKEDLRLLDQYRQSFTEAYEVVFDAVSQTLSHQCAGSAPTGRAAKSTDAIIAKLRRQSTRLTRMQDIAGCRVVVPNILEQEQVVALLVNPVFPGAKVIDRRANPSHSYRAVHVIATIGGKPVEVQIRSRLQHLWAELSERFSDVFDDPSIKYGGGDERIRAFLGAFSQSIERHERLETLTSETIKIQLQDPRLRSLYPEGAEEIQCQLLELLHILGNRLTALLQETGEKIPQIKKEML